ncbi:MAG TPA: 2-hydroxychromene-2-carboxylate isomerase [Burkholderiales bacterium]|nr:2-hydroxychromene-2-carboxylate isomerase [Burkholderiales bacterium]
MAAPIEFYYDFASPYGYLASTQIGRLAAKHGRGVVWKPMLLGVAFKATGGQPLPSVPLKGDYSRRDMERTARLMGIALRIPSKFPIASQSPARVIHWLAPEGASRQEEVTAALYRAYMVEDKDISSPEVTAEVAASVGLDRQKVLEVIADPAMKEKLRQETEAAIQRGVFGSPFIFVDGEPFWGCDRLPQVERWLETGGW